MPSNLLEYDEGYDAYELGEEFDPKASPSWQEGYFDAQANDQE